MENNKNKKSVKFPGDMLNYCDFIQVFVFTSYHHLKLLAVGHSADSCLDYIKGLLCLQRMWNSSCLVYSVFIFLTILFFSSTVMC